MPRKWEEYQPGIPAPPAAIVGGESGAPERAAPSSKQRAGSSFSARFGRVILQHGIAAIPSALYHYQGRMKLKIQHVWFVSYILSHKWDEDLPYPSLKKMNRSTRIDLRYLQRIRGELCGAGYLEVGIRQSEERGQETNTYDFSGLFDRLEKLIVGDPPVSNPIREEGPAPDLTELAELDSSFIARFGRIIVRRGVAAVPRAVFTHQAALGLTLQQVWFITYIFSFQWDTALPYPSLEKMAEHTGYSRTHLHEIKAELVEKGYLKLIPRTNSQGGRDTNAYDFSGLLDAVRAQLQPAAPGAKAETSKEATAKQGSEIPDLRRARRTTQVLPGGYSQNGGGALEFSRADGQERTSGGGQKRTERDGQEKGEGGGQGRTGRDGLEVTGMGGRQITSSIGPEPLRGTVHRRHKEETDNKETGRDDSNQVSLSEKVSTKPRVEQNEPSPPYSAYIAQVASDFSHELQDSEHIVSNVTQALRLWQTSGLDEEAFVGLMYEAKTLTRKYQTRPHWDGLANKMAYYFTVLRDQVQRLESGREGDK
jgi:hypothetical protein